MNKKLFITVFIFLCSFISAQELDDAYLDSLPDDVKKNVFEKMDAKESIENPVYRRASSSIDKDNIEDSNTTILFGSEFFDTIQTSFMPTNEPNLDSSYTLDFGDVLEIQLIGQEDSTASYTIKRDGSINLRGIGSVFLSGLTMSDASSLIKAKINSSYIGTEAFVSLKNIRDISILIAGNAFNPGIYTLNGNSNMLHAISMAGGVNEIGSYRDINLIRNGKVIDTLDIYEVLIFGTYNFSSSLRSGDSIVVNSINDVVAIESGVLRPALYELRDDESFDDLLMFANGLNNKADKENIIVKRIVNDSSKIFQLSFDELQKFDLKDYDSIFIREYKINSVTIEGAVKNPGTYNLSNGSTLSSLIKIAGGYEESAYPFGGFLENKKAADINQQSKDKLYETFIDNLVSNSSSVSTDDNNIALLLQQIKESPVSGRIIAEFDLDLIKNNPSLDTILDDEDRILIPYITQQVYLQGEISNAGAIRYSPNKGIDFYIEKAGGVLSTSDTDNIFVIHPNGETSRLSNKSALSFIQSDNNKLLIYPGSIIFIPQSKNFANSLQVASVWAPIISSIALSLTSLSVLNNSN